MTDVYHLPQSVVQYIEFHLAVPTPCPAQGTAPHCSFLGLTVSPQESSACVISTQRSLRGLESTVCSMALDFRILSLLKMLAMFSFF